MVVHMVPTIHGGYQLQKPRLMLNNEDSSQSSRSSQDNDEEAATQASAYFAMHSPKQQLNAREGAEATEAGQE